MKSVNYRYPGAQPFQSEQQPQFFGRDQDAAALHRMIKLEQVVVLYSRSGLGKSSLINAGLTPILDAEGNYRIVHIRFGAYNQSADQPQDLPHRRTIDAIRQSGFRQDRDTALHALIPPEDSLWYELKSEQLFTKDQKEILLVFDQFEELFTYPDAAIRQFKDQLAEALHTYIPQRFRRQVEQEVELQRHLSEADLSVMHALLPVRIVMAIRSDRISLLDKLSGAIPEVKKNWYELAPLNRLQAEDAILNPAYLPGRFASPVFDFSDEAIEQVLNFLTKDGNQMIESFQLQILCQAMERKVIREKIKAIQPAHLGNIQDIYENYYEDQIAYLPDASRQLAARRLIEEGLIFEEEERRLSLYEGQIFSQFGVSEELLRELEDTHLIRRESSMKGGYIYELSHDTLVGPVLKAKKRRLEVETKEKEIAAARAREQELAVARARADEERQLREQAQKNEQRARQRTRLAVLVSLLGLALAILAGWAYRQATVSKKEALQNLQLAEDREQEAQASFALAQQERQRAETNADTARAAQQMALVNLNLAREAENKATNALYNMERASTQTAGLLIRDARQAMLQLNYPEALEKLQTVISLGTKRRETADALYELAFYFNEVNQTDRSLGLLDTIALLAGGKRMRVETQRLRTSLNNVKDQSAQRQRLSMHIQKFAPQTYATLSQQFFPEMVEVAAGTFIMGCEKGADQLADADDCEADEVAHSVKLDAFQIGKTEITNRQYNLFVEATQKKIQTPPWGLQGDFPVVYVSWYDAIEFANWLSEQQDLQPVYTIDRSEPDPKSLVESDSFKWIISADWSANGYRLPTESEWEYAAIGADKDKEYKYNEIALLDDRCWHLGNSERRAMQTATKKANTLGLHDMLGNVWEWCWDWIGYYPLGETTNPRGNEMGPGRVMRSGSWASKAISCRETNRSFGVPQGQTNNVGFRLVRK